MTCCFREQLKMEQNWRAMMPDLNLTVVDVALIYYRA